jgi:hypothetical protein
VRRIVHDVLQGLAVIHQQGLVHQDIKPANILMTEDGRAKLADFGLATAVSLNDAAPSGTGPITGTPGYMAPEQVTRSAPVTAATDCYSLALTTITLLSGKRPYGPGKPLEILQRVASASAPQPEDFDIEGPIASWLSAILDRDPAARQADVETLLQSLPPSDCTRLSAPAILDAASLDRKNSDDVGKQAPESQPIAGQTLRSAPILMRVVVACLLLVGVGGAGSFFMTPQKTGGTTLSGADKEQLPQETPEQVAALPTRPNVPKRFQDWPDLGVQAQPWHDWWAALTPDEWRSLPGAIVTLSPEGLVVSGVDHLRLAVPDPSSTWEANPGVLTPSNGFGLDDFHTPLGHRRQEVVWADVAAGLEGWQPVRLQPLLPASVTAQLQMSDAAVRAPAARGSVAVKLLPADAAWSLWYAWSQSAALAARENWLGSQWQDALGESMQPHATGDLHVIGEINPGAWKLNGVHLSVRFPGLTQWQEFRYDNELRAFFGQQGALHPKRP